MLNTETLTSEAPNEQAKVVTFGNARELNNITKFGSACQMPDFGFGMVKSRGVGVRVRQAVNIEESVPPVHQKMRRMVLVDL